MIIISSLHDITWEQYHMVANPVRLMLSIFLQNALKLGGQECCQTSSQYHIYHDRILNNG